MSSSSPEQSYPPVPETDQSKRDRDDAAASDDNTETQKPQARKRRRVVISCTECHRRKQKCDRKLPCTNCVSRSKQDACQYDSGAPTAKGKSRAGERWSEQDQNDSIPNKVANFGYSQTGASTLGFLKKIEGEEPLSKVNPESGQQGGGDHFNTRERYKSLIRQLPARTYIDTLVNIYFADFNWQYFALDRDVFDKQLAEWYSLPFNLLSGAGPSALSPDLRAFPALLFQVLATALLVLPSGPDPTFDSLKYAGNMSFEDLALDYSESGVAILSLLGKRQMSLTTVLAGFLRAAFLKYIALVTEAWHAIGAAIRDGQEIGLHRDSLDPKPSGTDAESVLQNQWEIQRRRKVWAILVTWDIHTGIVLGRPTTIDLSLKPPTLPIDAPLPKDRSKTPVTVRENDTLPTPLTRCLWAYHVMAPLREVLDLEKEGPCPKDFSKVDQLHQKLLDIDDRTPAFFRLDNPDTRYDNDPECYWLPMVRATLPQLSSFNFIALHRPYIFTNPRSRIEALKASLKMLHAQRIHFQSLRPPQYKTFSLFFGTFDAIVLMASIYILFPKESPEYVQSAIQHFGWSVERFEAMSDRNALAKAALGVLRAIYVRLKKSLSANTQINLCPRADSFCLRSPLALSNTPASANSVSTTTATPGDSEDASPYQMESLRLIKSNITNGSASSGNGNLVMTPGSGDIFGGPTTTAPASAQGEPGLGMLSNEIPWASLQPIYATNDLVYNDLVGISQAVPQWADSSNLAVGMEDQPWQFDGDFSNDSVWNLLNQFTPF